MIVGSLPGRLLALSLAVCQDDEGPLGPAAAERSLLEVLEAVTLATDTAHAQELLADAAAAPVTTAAAEDLRRAILLAGSLYRGEVATRDQELPRDPGLLFLLARRFPVPTPVEWLPRLHAEVQGPIERDQALLELMAKTPRVEARATLRQWHRAGVELWIPDRLHATVLDRLGALEEPHGLVELIPLQAAPRRDIAHFAQDAVRRVHDLATRAGQGRQLADAYLAAADAMAPAFTLRIQAAASLVREAVELERADQLLSQVQEATAAAMDSGLLQSYAEALLGRATIAFLRGRIDDAVRLLELSRDWPREALREEFGLKATRLQSELLETLWQGMHGRPPARPFVEILRSAPSNDPENLLDQAWYGTFGPRFALEPMRRLGHSARLIEPLTELVAAIEETSGFTRYGLLDRDPDQEERAASWIFLSVAELVLEDSADPSRAAGFIEARLPGLRRLTWWRNQQLLILALVFQARAGLYLDDAAAAHQALEAALLTAQGLRTSYEQDALLRIDRDERPVPPVARSLWRQDLTFRNLEAHVLLSRGNVRATLDEDARGAAADLFRAGELQPWSPDRYIGVTLDFARRGFPRLAQRSLACVETTEDQLYDRACIDAHLGNLDAAVDWVHQHLEARTFTPEGRALQVRYMGRDPDLRSVWTHPRFPRE